MDSNNPKIPKTKYTDTAFLLGNKLKAQIFFYILEDGKFKPRKSNYETRIGNTLTPFKYKKPVIGEAGVFEPEEVWEDKLREGYHPLGFVQGAYKGPHHWHRKDDALVCAVLIKGVWQTRYFPRQNIPASTWNEACRILGRKPRLSR